MANLKNDLLYYEERLGEKIIAIIVGCHDDDRWSDNDRRPESARSVILSREEGLEVLDEEYDSGYGGADCFPFYAWSENFVFYVHEYDGSTHVTFIPRNPIVTEVDFS